MDRVLLIGHSHANCVAIAARKKLYAPSSPDYSINIIGNGAACLPGGLVLTDSVRRSVPNPIVTRAISDQFRQRPAPRVWLVSIIGGNQASRLGMFRKSTKYQTLLPGETSHLHEDELLIPADALVATLQKQMASLAQFMALLPHKQLAGVIHVEAPPPVRDSAFIFGHLPEKTRLLAVNSGIGEITIDSIADADYRRRLWECQSTATRRTVEAAGATYLLPPRDTMDEGGFLADAYRADAMHASPEYGAIVLARIEDHIVKHRNQQPAGSMA